MNFKRNAVALATLWGSLAGAAVAADEVVLKVHHFLPPSATAHKNFIEPWCAKIAAESAGRLKCQIYPAMSLGGTPPQLFDQAKDGIADIVWTVPGYQGGRFPVTELFELPFITRSAERSSPVVWNILTKYAGDEYKPVKPLIFHVHDGAQLHTTSKPIKVLADFQGMKLRAPTRQSTRLLKELGATPIGMPAPQVTEALSKGVVDGAMLPWEVVPPLKVHEVVKFHTETDESMPMLSNTVFVFAMNPARYEKLPPELKKVIDANSGVEASAWVGKVFDEARVVGRKQAQERGNVMYEVPATERTGWLVAGERVAAQWVEETAAKGLPAKDILAEAKAAINARQGH
ncbi:putative C4-dicarboxylate-binding periplasmic protein [Azoarcus olearius]|uniref:TRAP transporter substrate-binding protein n=1 Tax=Azoarcus sp. (strain BH72) TaxID=418699 RepID=UPI000806276D|nr:TRAP transporter substrate-binding protein [Azoarcus olearius]ANQ85646.1 putative C4-dicarboxylate-binding periplasmic protein [Azoarcus olearius]